MVSENHGLGGDQEIKLFQFPYVTHRWFSDICVFMCKILAIYSCWSGVVRVSTGEW